MLFNSALIGEIRQKESMLMADLAKRLGITEAYLSMLENGLRKPKLEVIENLVRVTKIPVEKWLIAEPLPESEEIPWIARSGAHAVVEIKKRLNREHRERVKAEERVWELEETVEHLIAEIHTHEYFERIACAESLSKSAKSEKLKELALWTMKDGELSFDEIQHILKVERSVFKSWLEAGKHPFECRLVDGGGILASSPGEAALCLRCFDCEAFESEECLGHGDEQRPENIIELLNRLKTNGVYDGVRQSQILEKYYSILLSARDISSIRYRGKNSLPIPDDIFYLDVRKKK